MSARLEGKRILITGATSGVGLAAVERFAQEGAALALVARGRPALMEAAAVARRRGAVAHVFPADLTDRAATTAAVDAAAEALGGLDVVVSNAGALAFGHLLEVDRSVRCVHIVQNVRGSGRNGRIGRSGRPQRG